MSDIVTANAGTAAWPGTATTTGNDTFSSGAWKRMDPQPMIMTPDDTSREQYERGLRLTRQIYAPRTLGLLVGGLCIASVLHAQSPPDWVWCLWLAQMLCWSHLAYWRARRHVSPYHAERQNLGIDSLLGGFWLAAMHFNLLPAIVVTTMLCLDNVAVGGVRLLLRGALKLVLGVLIGMLLLTPGQPTLVPSLGVLLATLPLMVIYPLAIGYLTYLQAHQLKRQKLILTELSRRDGLTGLYNRRHWEQCVDHCFQARTPAVIALLDLDHFKQINDLHGHALGDATLRRVAELLNAALASPAVFGRYGGEEFGVLLPDMTLSQANAAMQSFQRRLRHAKAPAPLAALPTCSIGLAEHRPGQQTYDGWMSEADQALYEAKRGGRDRIATSIERTSQSALDLG